MTDRVRAVERLLIVAEDPAIRALARAAARGLVDAIFEAPLTDLRSIAASITVDFVIVISHHPCKRLVASLSDHLALDRCVVVTTVGQARRTLMERQRHRD